MTTENHAAPAKAVRLIIGTTAGYNGVLRRGRRVLFDCGHGHTNRDESSGLNGTSARDCLTRLVRATRSPELVREHHDRLRSGGHRAAARAGSLRGAEQTREWAEQAREAFDAQVAELCRLIGDEPVFTRAGAVVLAPPTPERECDACGQLVRPSRYLPDNATGRPWLDWRTAVDLAGARICPATSSRLIHPDPFAPTAGR